MGDMIHLRVNPSLYLVHQNECKNTKTRRPAQPLAGVSGPRYCLGPVSHASRGEQEKKGNGPNARCMMLSELRVFPSASW